MVTGISCPNCRTRLQLTPQEEESKQFICPTCKSYIDLLAQGPSSQQIRLPDDILGRNCINHREVQAIMTCNRCSAAICQTCHYYLPELDLHICPNCTTKESTIDLEVIRVAINEAMMLAVFATIVFFGAVLFSAFVGAGDEAVEMIGGVVFMGALALSIYSLIKLPEKEIAQKTEYSVLYSITRYWNIAMLALFAILLLIGLFIPI